MRFGMTWIWIAAFAVVPASTAIAQAPFSVGGDPSVVPSDYEVTTFASGLDWPVGLEILQDDSLLAAINPGTNYFGATGELLRFVDTDNDGIADGPGTTLYSSFPGYVSSLARAADLVFASVSTSNTTHTIYVLRQGATPASAITLEDSIVVTFPPLWEHRPFAVTAREEPGSPGRVELYFNIGSESNIDPSSSTVTLSGMISGTANPDSLYRVILDDTGPNLAATDLLQIAGGLRNAFGCAFDPATGDLVLQDNGIDGLVDPNEPTSADELNVIAAADIGGSVEDFGFPERYVEYRTDNLIGAGGIDPTIAYQPVPSPNGAESEGAVEIVFAPPLFPPALRDGLFVGFHGRFSATGTANEENPVVYTDIGSGHYFHFIANTEPGIGHPDTFAVSGDRLFMADMAASSGFSTPGAGAIYRVRYAKAAAVPSLSDGGLGLLAFVVAAVWAIVSFRASSKSV